MQDLIALILLYRYEPHKLRVLLEQYDSPAEALNFLSSADHTFPISIDEARKRAENELTFMDRHGISTYYYKDENYPSRLALCADAPVLLFGKGNLQLEKGHFLSVVGTRQSSDRGRELIHRLILDLAKKVPDLTIVSGLAYGIDVAAHRAALEAKIPTIIVPAHGLDRIYPALHRQVAVDALENGGILTEYPSGTEPEKLNFITRNRIVAGLSEATLVVESRIKGGSLITANIAHDYSRDVFAIPGRPSDPNAEGCNFLIKSGIASLVENADDIISSMHWQPVAPVQTTMFPMAPALNEKDQQIMDLLLDAEEGVTVNAIVVNTQRGYSDIMASLLSLELQGLVRPLPGGIYKAIR